jgi:hypothetical protein
MNNLKHKISMFASKILMLASVSLFIGWIIYGFVASTYKFTIYKTYNKSCRVLPVPHFLIFFWSYDCQYQSRLTGETLSEEAAILQEQFWEDMPKEYRLKRLDDRH